MANNFLEFFLAKAGSVPGIRIDRDDFLREAFRKKAYRKNIDRIIMNGPLEAGVSLKEVGKIADQAIKKEAMSTIALSSIAGISGGAAMLATVPADIAQFYAHSFKVIQKLMYLYGWTEDIFDGDGDLDDATANMLVLYLGVMLGVGAAGKALAELAKAAAKPMIRDVSKKLIIKFITNETFRKIIIKIIQMIGLRMSAKMATIIASKAVPVIGAITSGIVTAVFFIPASNRLKKFFETGEFDSED